MEFKKKEKEKTYFQLPNYEYKKNNDIVDFFGKILYSILHRRLRHHGSTEKKEMRMIKGD